MAELLKNTYNQEFFSKFTEAIEQVIPNFDSKDFIQDVFDSEWKDKELKQRMRHIAVVLKKYLSDDFDQNVRSILKIIQRLQERGRKDGGFEYMFFPDFVELYGVDHYENSIEAFEQITQFTSCEFAVRPFIINHPNEMISQMKSWATHDHHQVRRLATEGCRPKLPWAMAIPFLKQDPTPIIPILESLKNDPSESVRRSVANNLNDISKDHPKIVIDLVKKWQGATVETDWVVKHASRTLLKQGNTEVMSLFGFANPDDILIRDFRILDPNVKIGESLQFAFKLTNTSNSSLKIRAEYAVYYQKANGTLSKKVFKISEKEYQGNSTTEIERKQSFKIITTRKFHLGLHQLSVIINGREFEKLNFQLIES